MDGFLEDRNLYERWFFYYLNQGHEPVIADELAYLKACNNEEIPENIPTPILAWHTVFSPRHPCRVAGVNAVGHHHFFIFFLDCRAAWSQAFQEREGTTGMENQTKIRQKIAMKGGTNDGGYIWVTTITKSNAWIGYWQYKRANGWNHHYHHYGN